MASKGSSSVRVPNVKQVDLVPLHTPGSLVWDSTSQSLFISTDTRWVPVMSTPSSSSGGVTVSSRATGTNVQANSVQAFKFLQMPSINTISSFPLQEPGGIVLTRDTTQVYVSTASAWMQLGGGTTLTSVGGGISLISSYVAPNYNIKSFIAGTGMTITPNFANTTLTFASTGVVTTVTAGPGISITGTASNPIVNNTGVLTVTGGTNVTITGTASNPIINASGAVATITAGPGISITGTALNPIVNNLTTLASEPTGALTYSVVSTNSVNPTPLTNKTITAGVNVVIVDSGTDLTISSTATSSITGFSAMKSGTQIFNYVGPQPVGGTVTGWTTAGAFNFDTSGAFNPVTGVYTVATAGVYAITATVTIQPNTNQNSYHLILLVNGVTNAYRTEDQPASNVGLFTTLRMITNALFGIGDTIEVFVSDTVSVIGSSFTVSGSPDTFLSILKF